jgi:hypothetical protein
MIHGVRVFSLIAWMTVKRAEDAIDVTDVRVVWVRVKYVCDPSPGVLGKSDPVCESTEVQQLRILKKKEPFLPGNSIPAPDLVLNSFHRHDFFSD